MMYDCAQLVGCVADTLVVCKSNPSILSDMGEPLLVRSVGRKQIAVTLDGEPGGYKRSGELLAQITIREEYRTAQAARS